MKKKWLFLTIFVLLFFSFAFEVHAQDSGNLVTEKLFPVSDTGEAIGVKVIKNEEWLTPKQWYKNYAPNPESNPSYIRINGYLAIKDGRTVYVGAVDVKDVETDNPKVYPRIYLISYNKGASKQTKQIYSYLLENWEFNTNIDSDVYKNQLRKDILRIYDIEQNKSLLKSYHSAKGNYPILSSGTYIKGQTTSKWPSWQETLGQELGGVELPIDPINKFKGDCGNCGEDQCEGTCYNPLTKEFFHTQGSHVYKYIASTEENCKGKYYVLSANLEYKPDNVNKVTWVGDKNVDIIFNDEDINSNFSYSPPETTPVCENNTLECGEVCDGTAENNTRPNAYCNESTNCQGWNCEQLWGDCDNNLANENSNGCETYLGDDIGNCGECNNVCESPSNAHPTCSNGECSWECDDSFRPYSNGCEYDHCISPYGEMGVQEDQDCSDEILNGSGIETRQCQDLHPPQWSNWSECTITECDDGFTEKNDECVTELDVPSTPTNLSADINNNDTVHKINLEWVDNSNNEDGFSLERKIGSESWIEVESDLSANLQSFIDSNLTGNTTYFYRLRSFNEDGYSGYSNDTSITTYECNPNIPATQTRDCSENIDNGSGEESRVCQANGIWGGWGECEVDHCDNGFTEEGNSCVVEVPSKPTNISGTPISTSEIQISWSDNSDNEGEFLIEKDGTILNTSLSENTTEYNDEGLDSNATYSYRVRACKNDNCSEWSNAIDITTQNIPVPSKPSTLQGNAQSDSEIYLTWSDNSDNEDEFVLYRNNNEVVRPTSNSTEYTDTGLSSSTTYTYHIKACNSGECSDLSNEVNVTTNSQTSLTPAQPTNLQGNAQSDSEIYLTWSDNSNNEDEFVLYRNDTEIARPTSNSTEYTDTGLSSSTTYIYQIKACNSDGCSGLSDTLSVATSSGSAVSPAAPSNLSAEDLSTTEIKLTWSDNSNNEDEFLIEKDGAVLDTSLSSNATEYTDTGLSPDTRYTYKVKACNQGVCSDWSDYIQIFTKAPSAQTPAQPSDLSGGEDGGNDAVLLTWTDNSDNEDWFEIKRNNEIIAGSISDYLLSIDPNDSEFSDNDEIISPNIEFNYSIRACDKGEEPRTLCSDWVSPISMTTEPDATSNPNDNDLLFQLNAQVNSSTEVNLTWSEKEGFYEEEANKFRIYRTTNINSPPFKVGDIIKKNLEATESPSYIDTGLNMGETYKYQVVGYSGVWWASNVRSITLDNPSKPTNLGATVSTSISEIELTWEDNSNNETKFEIEANGSILTEVRIGHESYTHDCDPGTTYTYRVRACNALGCSDWSSEASATTVDDSGFSSDEDPTNLTINSAGEQTICFSWDDNSNTNEGYTVEAKCENNSWVEVWDFKDEDMNSDCDGSLPSGVEFSFRVRAFKSMPDNDRAYTNYSNIGTATTTTTVCCSSDLWPESWCSFGCSCSEWNFSQ